MTKREQREFVLALINNVQCSILEKLHKIPDNWDGHELRQYIADKFKDCNYIKMNLKRKRDYYNTIIVNNLV